MILEELLEKLRRRGTKLGSMIHDVTQGEALPLEGVLEAAGAAGGGIIDTADYMVPDWLVEALEKTPVVQGAKYIGKGLKKNLWDEFVPEGLIANDIAYQSEMADPRVKNMAANLLDATGLLGVRGAFPSRRGYAFNSPSNTIPGFYGDSINDLKTIGQTYKQFFNKAGVPENIGSRLSGIGQWITESAGKRIGDSWNPVAKARYMQTGISPESTRVARKIEGKRPKEDIHPVLAQLQYNQHMIKQNDRKGAVDPLLTKLADDGVEVSMDFPAGGFTGADIKRAMKEQGYDNIYTDEQLDWYAKELQKSWGISNKGGNLNIKSSTTATGNHMFDVQRTPANQHLNRFFKEKGTYDDFDQFEKDIKQLAEDKTIDKTPTGIMTLAKRAASKDPVSGKRFDWEGVNRKTPQAPFTVSSVNKEDGSVTITTGAVGSALTEGGINAKFKVYMNGDILPLGSDKHDFIEKSTDRFLQKDQLMATTPVIRNAHLPSNSAIRTPTKHEVDLEVQAHKKDMEQIQKDKKKALKEEMRLRKKAAGTHAEKRAIAAEYEDRLNAPIENVPPLPQVNEQQLKDIQALAKVNPDALEVMLESGLLSLPFLTEDLEEEEELAPLMMMR